MPRSKDDGASTEELKALELFCFGPPSAKLGGGDPPPDVAWRKHIALLIYLALTPNRSRTRDHLVGVFWPEKSEDRARHSLNEALRRLRLSLGPGRLVSGSDVITLSGDKLVVDALEFNATIDTDPQRAAALFRGEFLEGFSLGDAPEFDMWASHEQRRFSEKGAAVFVTEGERRLAASRFSEALDDARRAIQLYPVYEPAIRLMMRAQALSGDPTGALANYHEFKGKIEEDLGETTSRELESLSDRIRKSRWRQASVTYADPEPPLLGRQSEHAAAFGLVTEALANGPRTLLVTSDPGMGKSRLLTECSERLALDGAIIATARPLESDSDARWSTLRALMRGGLLNAPGMAATDSTALGVLAALVPELAERVEPREPQDHAQVASAFAALLTAIAEETPLALMIDDAHLSDGSTLGALYGGLVDIQSVPVVVLLAARSMAQDMPRELLSLESEVGRSIPGTCVRLPPLTTNEMRQLVAALAEWCDNNDEIDRLTRRLVFETSGDPFLAVTLLRGLNQVDSLREDVEVWPKARATLETPLPIPMPNLVRMSIIARVTPLDKDVQQILAAASVGGPAFDLDLVTSLTELDLAGVEDKLPELERHRFIALDGERYKFTAPLIAQIVQNEFLTHGQRQSLRRRAVQHLAGRDDLESGVLRAELMAKTDPGEEAFDAAADVAQSAMSSGAMRTARRALHAAERALGSDGGTRRKTLDDLRAQLHQVPQV